MFKPPPIECNWYIHLDPTHTTILNAVCYILPIGGFSSYEEHYAILSKYNQEWGVEKPFVDCVITTANPIHKKKTLSNVPVSTLLLQ